MKREIRFRLRIGNKVVGYEKWYKGVQITDTNPCGANPCWLYSKDGEYWNPDFIWHTEKDEFTGLLDKHGKEIFEGDIIEHYPNQEDYFRGEVVFEEGAFAIMDEDNLNSLKYKEFEIIGNIYENESMLNKG